MKVLKVVLFAVGATISVALLTAAVAIILATTQAVFQSPKISKDIATPCIYLVVVGLTLATVVKTLNTIRRNCYTRRLFLANLALTIGLLAAMVAISRIIVAPKTGDWAGLMDPFWEYLLVYCRVMFLYELASLGYLWTNR